MKLRQEIREILWNMFKPSLSSFKEVEQPLDAISKAFLGRLKKKNPKHSNNSEEYKNNCRRVYGYNQSQDDIRKMWKEK